MFASSRLNADTLSGIVYSRRLFNRDGKSLREGNSTVGLSFLSVEERDESSHILLERRAYLSRFIIDWILQSKASYIWRGTVLLGIGISCKLFKKPFPFRKVDSNSCLKKRCKNRPVSPCRDISSSQTISLNSMYSQNAWMHPPERRRDAPVSRAGFKARPHRGDAAARDEIDRHVPERRHGGRKGGRVRLPPRLRSAMTESSRRHAADPAGMLGRREADKEEEGWRGERRTEKEREREREREKGRKRKSVKEKKREIEKKRERVEGDTMLRRDKQGWR